ncbi:MAG: hypothetical protein ACTSRH_19025 [Promethearchaeota archaeon]
MHWKKKRKNIFIKCNCSIYGPPIPPGGHQPAIPMEVRPRRKATALNTPRSANNFVLFILCQLFFFIDNNNNYEI